VVATLAVDPRDLLNPESRRATPLSLLTPPSLLDHAPGVGAPMPPVRSGSALSAIHRGWAELDDLRRLTPAHGVRGRLRSRVARRRAHPSPADDAERELVGSIIQAAEVLATRCDELSHRVETLEAALQEVVEVVSEDLVAVRAALVDG